MTWVKYIVLVASYVVCGFYANAKDIEVCKTCAFSSIKSAIEKAENGDRIFVQHGVYFEHTLIINKRIRLIGKEFPVVDAKQVGDIFILMADGVTIEGFVIQNSGASTIKEFSGIRIAGKEGCTIKNNVLNNNYFAIYVSNGKRNRIIGNKINGKAIKETFSGNGIHLWKCEQIEVMNNNIHGHRDGIYFEFAKGCYIYGNSSYNNLRYGLHFMFSDGNTYSKNKFFNNGAGVAVMYTKNVTMVNNSFLDNWGPTSYGLLLKDITNSVIDSNIFSKNTIGVYMEGASKLCFRNNTFESNGCAMKILGNCVNDTLINNNFISNTFDLVTNSSSSGNYNYVNQNYWDKYKGYDLNKDKVGDIPYRPVSLFSILVERVPYAILLLRSFLVELLDGIERALPAFIPETLEDQEPLIEKIK